MTSTALANTSFHMVTFPTSRRHIHGLLTDLKTYTTITRLLCKMLITAAVLARFSLVEDGDCRSCRVTDSLQRILFVCSKYRTQRKLYWDNTTLNNDCFRSFVEFLNKFSTSKDFRASTIRFLHCIGRF